MKIEKMMGIYSKDAAESEDPVADSSTLATNLLINSFQIADNIIQLVEALESEDWFGISSNLIGLIALLMSKGDASDLLAGLIDVGVDIA